LSVFAIPACGGAPPQAEHSGSVTGIAKKRLCRRSLGEVAKNAALDRKMLFPDGHWLCSRKGMENYSSLNQKLSQINQDVQSLIHSAKSIPGLSDSSFEDWEKTCESLKRQLDEEVIRVAVVGPIKSGKSTFLNSILRGDYLKRGAGVVTSIVTRVRAGQALKATLFFKNWDEINADVRQALALFPAWDKNRQETEFDIRQAPLRQSLQQELNSLGSEQLVTRDTRNINNVLISSYLKGYDTVFDIIANDTTRHFEREQFADHKAFVGNENLAVYLKDVELEINSPGLESNFELADCQGSDSSNPLHLAMIQDYLLVTNLIVYVISSRTGLRRADIRFLSMIKKIGILDNILFVVNCDFSEHEEIDDLRALVAQVTEELSMIKKNPDVYTFSALYNLFNASVDKLSVKEKARLNQWKDDTELLHFADREVTQFDTAFNGKLTHKRNSLLYKNHLERLNVILSGIDNWLGINREILNKDAQSAREMTKKLEDQQERLSQIKSSINTTLTGAASELKQKLSGDVNQFFDRNSGDIIANLIKYIKNYKKIPQLSEKKIDLSLFSKNMYTAFQDFKQSLDSYITEVINPEVMRFIKKEEQKIKTDIEQLIRPYEVMLDDAYTEYSRVMKRFGISADFEDRAPVELPDMEALIRQAGLRPPAIVAAMQYTASVKTAAIVRFGFLNLHQRFKKLLKKPVKQRKEVVQNALRGGVQQMKRETLKSLADNLKDYRENLKFRYFSKLVDETAKGLAETLLERFQVYFHDLTMVGGKISDKSVDKEQVSDILKDMKFKSYELKDSVGQLKQDLEGNAVR
jgi:GTPase SAR1 family protein